MDLIFAEATPPGRGGVSILRISGEGARSAVGQLTGSLAKPRHAYLRKIQIEGQVLDQALVIWFEAGQSFTGEEVVELHLHGAPVIMRRLSQVLIGSGMRLAEPGEFTKRAFINGQMDLAEVEALGDLLSAETESQRLLAMRNMNGELSNKVAEWRNLLIRAGALVESSVDFADEDVPDDIPDEVFDLLEKLRVDLVDQIAGYDAAELIRNGFEVAIVGPPNVGKSSLLNRLARRDMAIVSDIAGTTRDIIELRMDLRGLAVTFLDTAGLRQSTDEIESLGIDRTRERAQAADLRIHLSFDGTIDDGLWRSGDLVVMGKSDLRSITNAFAISSVTGEGIDDLLTEIFDRLSGKVAKASLVSHQRQFQDMVGALAALYDVNRDQPEILSESIRIASSSLDHLLGKIGAEDYLDVIFTSFCIGK